MQVFTVPLLQMRDYQFFFTWQSTFQCLKCPYSQILSFVTLHSLCHFSKVFSYPLNSERDHSPRSPPSASASLFHTSLRFREWSAFVLLNSHLDLPCGFISLSSLLKKKSSQWTPFPSLRASVSRASLTIRPLYALVLPVPGAENLGRSLGFLPFPCGWRTAPA